MLNIIRAQRKHATVISELALRSKAHWGYSLQFIRAVKSELTYSENDVTEYLTYIAKKPGQVAGFYQLVELNSATVEMEALFVDPLFIGKGIGRQLFDHAVNQARELGYQSMSIQSDPNAENFYLRLGCIKEGEKPSLSIPGRMLPMMRFNLVLSR